MITWLYSQIKGRFLSIKGKVKVIRKIENGKRNLMCVRNFVSKIVRSQKFGKAVPKLLVRLNRTD